MLTPNIHYQEQDPSIEDTMLHFRKRELLCFNDRKALHTFLSNP